MARKKRFHSIYSYLFLILIGAEFAACHHKQKASEDSIVKEMPLPDPNKNYYSPESYQKEIAVNEDEPYRMVEQMPQFSGGEQNLLDYISKNLHYPVIAQENGIQGRVVIRFVVTRTGKVEKTLILRSIDTACDKEALRVVKSFPRFIPGKQNGKNVSVWYTLPINFRLK